MPRGGLRLWRSALRSRDLLLKYGPEVGRLLPVRLVGVSRIVASLITERKETKTKCIPPMMMATGTKFTVWRIIQYITGHTTIRTIAGGTGRGGGVGSHRRCIICIGDILYAIRIYGIVIHVGRIYREQLGFIGNIV